MKKIIFLVFSLISVNAFSQTFEKCFKPLYNSGLTSIISDSSGFFYSIGSTNSSMDFGVPGFIIKTDASGNLIHKEYFLLGDLVYLNQIIQAPDGNLIISGRFTGCDTGDKGGILMKVDTACNLLWYVYVDPVSIFDQSNNWWAGTITLQNGNIIYATDSALYFYNESGDTLFSTALNQTITAISKGINEQIYCTVQSGFIQLDSAGHVIDSISFGWPVGGITILSDSTYLLVSTNTLIKTDSMFNVIGQIDPSIYNYHMSSKKITGDKIWARDPVDPGFISFDHNLQIVDSFRTEYIDVFENDFSVVDTTIMVAGNEPYKNRSCFLKTFSTNGNADYYDYDIALTSMSFDTAYVVHPIQLPANVWELFYVCRITVENVGLDTIHNFFWNAESYLSGPCGTSKIMGLTDSISLAPGQTMSVVIDTLSEYGIVLTQFPYSYQFCTWLSCPDSKPDLDDTNNYSCGIAIVHAPVGVNESERSVNVNVYPNPFENEIEIEIADDNFKNARIEICDIAGKKILSRTFSKREEHINTSEFSVGVYLINVVSDDFLYSKKIIRY